MRLGDCDTKYSTAKGAVVPSGEGLKQTPVGYLNNVRDVPTRPNLLSMGALVEDNYKFWWSRADGAWACHPGGDWERLGVTSRVPFVGEPNAVAMKAVVHKAAKKLMSSLRQSFAKTLSEDTGRTDNAALQALEALTK